MKKILVLLMIVFMLCGCNAKGSLDIEKLMEENEYVIIDVRTHEEYKTGHLVDSVNIPYNKIGESEIDKNKIVFVYCRSGNRSEIAYNTLTNLGYTVYDLGAFSDINLPKE